MASNITVASANIELKFDISKLNSSNLAKVLKKSVEGAEKKVKIDKSLNVILGEQIRKQRELISGDSKRIAAMKKLSTLSFKIGSAGIGVVGGGLKTFLSTTDPMARKLNTSLMKVKLSFWNLMANIGKQATIKFDLINKLEKLNQIIKNIKKSDIDKLFNGIKIAFMVAGFAKMAQYAFMIKKFFDALTLSRLVKQMAEMVAAQRLMNAGGGAKGVAGGAGTAAGGSAIGSFLGSFLALFKSKKQRISDAADAAGFRPEAKANLMKNMKNITLPSRFAPLISLFSKFGNQLISIFTRLGSIMSKLAAPFVALLTIFGLLFSRLGDGETTLEKTRDGLIKTLNFFKWLGDQIWGVVKIVGEQIWSKIKFFGDGILFVFDLITKGIKLTYSGIAFLFSAIGQIIGGLSAAVVSLGKVLSDVSRGKFTDVKQNLVRAKDELVYAFNFKDIAKQLERDFDSIMNPKASKGSKSSGAVPKWGPRYLNIEDQQKFSSQQMSVSSGGFGDLNKMFQDMFVQNANDNLIRSNEELTGAVKELAMVMQKDMAPVSFGKDGQLKSNVFTSSAFINNLINK